MDIAGDCIGARIKALRVRRGWTQRDLDREAQLSHGYTSKLERSRVKSPSVQMLERIATALDFPTDFFFSEIAHQDVESTQRMEPTSQSADSDISAIQADITVIEMLDTARLAALRTIISDIRKQVESEHRTRRKPEH